MEYACTFTRIQGRKAFRLPLFLLSTSLSAKSSPALSPQGSSWKLCSEACHSDTVSALANDHYRHWSLSALITIRNSEPCFLIEILRSLGVILVLGTHTIGIDHNQNSSQQEIRSSDPPFNFSEVSEWYPFLRHTFIWGHKACTHAHTHLTPDGFALCFDTSNTCSEKCKHFNRLNVNSFYRSIARPTRMTFLTPIRTD